MGWTGVIGNVIRFIGTWEAFITIYIVFLQSSYLYKTYAIHEALGNATEIVALVFYMLALAGNCCCIILAKNDDALERFHDYVHALFQITTCGLIITIVPSLRLVLNLISQNGFLTTLDTASSYRELIPVSLLIFSVTLQLVLDRFSVVRIIDKRYEFSVSKIAIGDSLTLTMESLAEDIDPVYSDSDESSEEDSEFEERVAKRRYLSGDEQTLSEGGRAKLKYMGRGVITGDFGEVRGRGIRFRGRGKSSKGAPVGMGWQFKRSTGTPKPRAPSPPKETSSEVKGFGVNETTKSTGPNDSSKTSPLSPVTEIADQTVQKNGNETTEAVKVEEPKQVITTANGEIPNTPQISTEKTAPENEAQTAVTEKDQTPEMPLESETRTKPTEESKTSEAKETPEKAPEESSPTSDARPVNTTRNNEVSEEPSDKQNESTQVTDIVSRGEVNKTESRKVEKPIEEKLPESEKESSKRASPPRLGTATSVSSGMTEEVNKTASDKIEKVVEEKLPKSESEKSSKNASPPRVDTAPSMSSGMTEEVNKTASDKVEKVVEEKLSKSESGKSSKNASPPIDTATFVEETAERVLSEEGNASEEETDVDVDSEAVAGSGTDAKGADQKEADPTKPPKVKRNKRKKERKE